jgi:hypothetical protein
LTNAHLDRLTILAGIHLGKALKGFQDQLEGASITKGHVAEALAILYANAPSVRDAIRLPLLSWWFDPISDAIYVSICHHGARR